MREIGAVGAWIKVLAGFFILGSTFIFAQPVFDFLFAVADAFGGNAVQIKTLIQTALTVAPIPIAISLIVWGFVEATRGEDASYYYWR